MVGQVKVVGILMIVHGVLEALMGLLFVSMAVLMGFAAPPPPAGPGGPPVGVQNLVLWTYAGMGLLTVAPGVLNLIAGIRVLKFRGRTFAIVALFTNLFAFASCYCTLTCIALMIYGLIALFNSDVAWAFDAVGRGADPEDVLSKFNRRRYGDDRDDYDDRQGGPRYGEERRPRWDDDEPGDRRGRDYDRD